MNQGNNPNTDVNGYLSELIHNDKNNIMVKRLRQDKTEAKFCRDCVNDDMGKLDITV